MINLVVLVLILALFGGLLRAWPAPVRVRLLRLMALGVALGALILLFRRDASWINLGWIPWIEPGLITMDERGSELAGLAMLGYALLLWQDADQPALGWWQALAAPLLLAASFAALNVNHFLYRYIFLEAAALTTLAMTVRSSDWHDLANSFLILRLGDLALLGMILLLWQAHGTLLISPMLASSAQAADSTTWLASLLGLLAVWIKLGLYPFDRWLMAAGRTANPERWAVTAAGLPLLGAYLFYRLEDSFHALGLNIPLVVLGGELFCWALLRALRSSNNLHSSNDSRLPNELCLHHLRVAHDALALVAIPLGWPYVYLYSFVPVRGLLELLAARVPQKVSSRPTAESTWPLVQGFSRIVHTVDENVLDRGFVGLQRSALAAGRCLRRLHTGRLRINLAWMGSLIVLTLALVAVFSFL